MPIHFIKLNLVINQSTYHMNSRFFYSNMKEYFAKYRTKTREKRINFMNYLRMQRQKIIERQREKLFKRIVFWSIFLGGSFLIYDELYRKKVEINKMNSKLQNFYSAIMLKQSLKQSVSCVTLSPKALDQLANIISLAYRYHYKVIVRMDEVTKRQKIIISQKFDSKCLFINLSALNKVKIDEINNTIYAQSGATCSDVNNKLEQNGFSPLFPAQFQKQTIYDVITNNLPLNNGQLSKSTISMELLSASGKNFRSAGETNKYGQIPSLNPLFIGTGGVFAIPTGANIRILKKQMQNLAQEHIKINIHDINQKIIALRKFNQINSQYIDLQITNSFEGKQQNQGVFITCKQKFPISKGKLENCSDLTTQKGIPFQKTISSPQKTNFNLFFSVNNKIFQEFLLRFDRELPYEYKNGLLKVALHDTQDHEKYISVINEITNNNGALVWCDIPQILLKIKQSTDSSQVGAELMRKIVEVRQGLDHRNVLYSHSRYEDYFAKGLFRKLTEYFW